MTRVCAGDEDALGVLMERWEAPVKSLIGRIVLNSSEAAELASETFVRVWLRRQTFRIGADFRPWLFAIAVNLSRNRLRWWRRRPEVSLEQWSEIGGQHDNGAIHDEMLERASTVCDAIAALPTQLREAIVLFAYENLSHSEIAALVGASPKAVERRIARARERLRLILERVP